MARIAILGIDGGSLKLIERWKDELPNFRRIMNNGVYGELESTFPPLTCPAWPCMFTGKNPAKLGMYGFTTARPNKEYKLGFSSSNDYHDSSLWKVLNDYHRDVGTLNIPITFPPHKVNSFMVCGIGSPESRKSNYTYPPSLQRTLDRLVGGYEIAPPILAPSTKAEQFIKELGRLLDKRLKAASYLIKNFPWDCFVCVFWVLDPIQHFFWHYLDESHPHHHPGKYQTVIKDFYKKVDMAIGELMTKLPQETNIFIVSDHGFGGMHGYFAVNRWLEINGFLRFKENVQRPKLNAFLRRIKESLLFHLNTDLVRFAVRILPKRLVTSFALLIQQRQEVQEIYSDIDWSRTKAYGLGSTGMISINLKGREPEGIVEPGEEYEATRDDIIARLKRMVHPQTGEPLNLNVHRREEVYQGKYFYMAPDIIFMIDEYPQSLSARGDSEWVGLPTSEHGYWTGWHRPQGMFMAYGPDIKKSGLRLDNLKIYSLTPTVLHMFGLPVPGDMDGRVLTEIFDEDSEPGRRKVVYRETDYEPQRIRHKVGELKRQKKL